MADSKNRQFLLKLLETFRAEAREHITKIAARLSELAQGDAAARAGLVEVAFREAHSLKAAARAVSQGEMERVCQAMEGVFAALKRGEHEPTRALIDALHAANDTLADLLAAEESGKPVPERSRTDARLRALESARGGVVEERTGPQPEAPAAPAIASPAEAPAPPSPACAETIRLPVRRLDALLRQTEDMLSVKLGAQSQSAAAARALADVAQWRKEWARLRGSLDSLRSVAAAKPLLGFLEGSERQAASLEATVAGLARNAAEEARSASVRIDGLLRDIKQILMLEARTLLDAMPRAIRDLAREQGKDVDFRIEGGELEIDRRILEEIREPLLHLLRNAVDHGIDKPAAREKRGKLARAALRLALTPLEGGKVEFAVTDDGDGVPLKALAARAVKMGLLTAPAAAQAGAAELLPLIFHSGISTSPMITEISGRGLGLAIVRERVERLGGTAAVESVEGRGATFRLVVPLTLATFRGIPVRAAAQTFVIPTLGVERVLRARSTALRTVENRPMVAVNGGYLPLVSLAETLELPAPADPGDAVIAVVLGSATGRVAFRVDEVQGDQEVLVKPLGKCLERVRNVAGATVLGDGRIAPILNIHDLLKSAARAAHAPAAGAAAEAEPRAAVQLRVLVVEDSITARGLLKNILEAAGYAVKTAVDGVEAWAALKLEHYDLVVSDVEMPRMNGFDLTARIRADKRTAELPVVLLTALATREDRERGVEAGANAYLLKGEFDHQRLLEVLRGLA